MRPMIALGAQSWMQPVVRMLIRCSSKLCTFAVLLLGCVMLPEATGDDVSSAAVSSSAHGRMHACVTSSNLTVTPVAFGLPYVQQLVLPTRLKFSGHMHEFEPLAPLRVPGTTELSPLNLDNCEHWATKGNALWAQTAAMARMGLRTHLVVLGTSVTAGCGSAEDVTPGELYGAGPQHNRGVGLSQLCDPMRSWGRHLRDFLVRQMGYARAPEVEINPKNAVSPDWFARCTTSRVPRDTNIVLLEVLTNVWWSNLSMLVQAVRRAAPNATVAFLMWPHAHGLPNPARYSDRINMMNAAEAEGVDAIDVASLINEIWTHRPVDGVPAQTSMKAFFHSWYGRGGKDIVHPNPPAHQLLGFVAARYVARRLANAEAAACVDVASGRGRHEIDQERLSLEKGRRSRLHVDAPRFEKCYDSADTLPVYTTYAAGFELVNEGGDKGVRKMGYRSHRIGDTLLLGPLPMESGCVFMPLVVTVGYLLSAIRPNQGAFVATCHGCACTNMKSFFQKELFPFPLVQTRLVDASSHWKAANISITATTEFLAFFGSASLCIVNLTHVASASAHHWEKSTIRIDSLSVATPIDKTGGVISNCSK